MTYSQPGIFNALDDWGTLGYGMSPANTPTQNAMALQATINAAQVNGGSGNLNGAIVLIPSFAVDSEGVSHYGNYQLEAASSPAITIPDTGNASPLLIMGTGPGTTLEMLTPGITLFSVDSGLTAFQDLTVVDASEHETTAGTAFDFGTGGGGSCKLFRVSIIDFPNAIVVENAFAGMNILACTISYDTSYSGVACTAVKTSGAETNIEQCSLTFSASGSGSYTGIDIVASSYARVTDTQVSGFGTGILLGAESAAHTARGAFFTGLDVEAVGACVNIDGPTYDVCFSNCIFAPSDPSLPGDYGVIVGTSLGENSKYDTIRFTACTVEGFGVYGLMIQFGQNLQVNGGSYSGNGTAGIAIVGDAVEVQITGANCIGTAGSATQLYGIYITAGEDVQIVGVNCSGNGVAGIEINGAALTSVQDVRIVGAVCANAVFGGASQQYGIYIQGASGVLIDGCTLTGNTSYAVYLSTVKNVTVSACDVYSSGAEGIFVGSPAGNTQYVFIRGCNGAQYTSHTTFLTVSGELTGLEVTDCAGYNDLGNTILANATSAPSGPFSGLTVPTPPYYGPTAFYLAATGATVTIDLQSTHLSSGGFTLAPGESAEISSGTVTHFLMVGK
ncbi:MAG: right-handed parallel beta-helix repeat-containing protein [Terracidiphilus sp.]